jgi:hypothetical protein
MTVRVLIVARPQTARRKIARIRTRAAVVHFVAAAMPHRKVDFAVANACQFRRQFCQTSRREVHYLAFSLDAALDARSYRRRG